MPPAIRAVGAIRAIGATGGIGGVGGTRALETPKLPSHDKGLLLTRRLPHTLNAWRQVSGCMAGPFSNALRQRIESISQRVHLKDARYKLRCCTPRKKQLQRQAKSEI